MPSLEHDGVVGLFRDNPPLALRILADLFHLPIPAHARVRVANTALDQLLPIEFRADLVLDVLDTQGQIQIAIILEVQRDIDHRKKYSWPVYVTVSRAERECPVILMVVTVDEQVADWAEQLIDLGFGRGTILPVILGPHSIPAITDELIARTDTELALLSGMTHGNETNGEDVLRATFEGIRQLDNERALVYFQVLWNVLREPMQKVLARLVMEKQSLQDTPGFSAKFLEEFRAVLFQLAKEEAFHDGEAKNLRDNILRLARRRNLTLSDQQQERVTTCTDRETLERWFDNAVDASSADDIFR